MINDHGRRVAAPQPAAIPPHMLEAMTSAGQQQVLGRWKRAEPTASGARKRAATTTRKGSAKTVAPRKRAPAKRAAKKSVAAAPPPTETKE